MKHLKYSIFAIFGLNLIFLSQPLFGAVGVSTPALEGSTSHSVYLPQMEVYRDPSACPVPTGAMVSPVQYTQPWAIHPASLTASLESNGLGFAAQKIGFHASVGGNRTGISDYFAALNSAGVPIVMKSADDFGVLKEILDLPGSGDVDHVLVFA